MFPSKLSRLSNKNTLTKYWTLETHIEAFMITIFHRTNARGVYNFSTETGGATNWGRRLFSNSEKNPNETKKGATEFYRYITHSHIEHRVSNNSASYFKVQLRYLFDLLSRKLRKEFLKIISNFSSMLGSIYLIRCVDLEEGSTNSGRSVHLDEDYYSEKYDMLYIWL